MQAHIHALDSYRPGDSPVHRLDPRVKLTLALLLILTGALTSERGWVAFALLEVCLLATAALSRIGIWLVQRRSALVLPFTLAAVTAVFSTPGRALWTMPFLSTSLNVTASGLLRFAAIVVRSYLSVQAAVLLATTTSFPDLLWGMRALHLPRVLVAISGFLYRYLFVIADEARRLMRARAARSATVDGRAGRSLIWRARVTGGMAGSLFIRSYERSERIYEAMLARGYDGEVRTLSTSSLRLADVAVGAIGVLVLVGVLVVGQMVV